MKKGEAQGKNFFSEGAVRNFYPKSLGSYTKSERKEGVRSHPQGAPSSNQGKGKGRGLVSKKLHLVGSLSGKGGGTWKRLLLVSPKSQTDHAVSRGSTKKKVIN